MIVRPYPVRIELMCDPKVRLCEDAIARTHAR